jgi:hypothetical protein
MDYFENATQVVLEAAQHDERAWRWMGMVDRRLVREESQG